MPHLIKGKCYQKSSALSLKRPTHLQINLCQVTNWIFVRLKCVCIYV